MRFNFLGHLFTWDDRAARNENWQSYGDLIDGERCSQR